jgi:pyridoxine kinase
VPNITEACFMTDTEYKENYDEAYVKDLLTKLAALGAKITVLTGVSFEEGKTGVMGYEKETGEYFYYAHDKLTKSYHGTGDIFASTCVGAMMRGKSWKDALVLAANYTAECIRLTMEDPEGRCYGVNFEQAIPFLLKQI